MAYAIIKDLKALTDKDLINYFARCNVRITKAANGLQNIKIGRAHV